MLRNLLTKSGTSLIIYLLFSITSPFPTKAVILISLLERGSSCYTSHYFLKAHWYEIFSRICTQLWITTNFFCVTVLLCILYAIVSKSYYGRLRGKYKLI